MAGWMDGRLTLPYSRTWKNIQRGGDGVRNHHPEPTTHAGCALPVDTKSPSGCHQKHLQSSESPPRHTDQNLGHRNFLTERPADSTWPQQDKRPPKRLSWEQWRSPALFPDLTSILGNTGQTHIRHILRNPWPVPLKMPRSRETRLRTFQIKGDSQDTTTRWL